MKDGNDIKEFDRVWFTDAPLGGKASARGIVEMVTERYVRIRWPGSADVLAKSSPLWHVLELEG